MKSENIIYNIDKTKIIGCQHSSEQSPLIIPETVIEIEDYGLHGGDFSEILGGESIARVGSHAFENSLINNIELSNTLTSIGDYAFANCDNITSITIPESVTSLGDYLFDECGSLTDIVIKCPIKELPENLFNYYYSNNITNILLPDGIENLNIDMFRYTRCYQHKPYWEDGLFYIGNYLISAENYSNSEMIVKEGTKVIGENIFDNWYNSPVINVQLPQSVEKISERAFQECENLETINLENIKYIGNDAFTECGSLKEINLTSAIEIGEDAFIDCENVNKITFGNNLIRIGESAFCGCSNVSSLVIPDSIEIIENYAFEGCINLTELTIGKNVKKIGQTSFGYCLNLPKMTFLGKPEYIDPFAFYNTPKLKTINVPWAKDEVPGAPWGATAARINYNVK